MKILVTGGAGFIGSHVCEALLGQGHEVVCVDDFNDYYSPAVKEQNIKGCLKSKGFLVRRIDIRDYEGLAGLFRNNRFDKVIHLAARAGVRPSLQDPKLYFDVNVSGTANLLELARIHGIKTFIFASSSSIYGVNKKVPFSEEDAVDDQISPYATSKRCGELLCQSYSKAYSLNITCLRFFTAYGPRGRPDMAPYLFMDLMHNKKPITVFGDGSTQRDYTYIGDIVDGVLSALSKSYRFEIINLGDSHPVSLTQFIETIESAMDAKCTKVMKPMPQGDVPMTYADISKAGRLLGYAPKTGLKAGVKKMVSWYLQGSQS